MNVTRNFNKLFLPLLALSLVPWLAGCESAKQNTLTGRLWQRSVGDYHHEPAMDPRMSLYQTRDNKDILVRYDEMARGDGSIRRRSFLLQTNQKKLAAGQKPKFLSERQAGKIQLSGRIIPYHNLSEGKSGSELQAIVGPDEINFTIVTKGAEIGSYSLPTYESKVGKVVKLAKANTFTRLVALPAAIMGDTAKYGGEFCAVAAVTQGPRIALLTLIILSHCHK